MEIWVPTEPDLDDRGRIRSLIPLLGDAATAFPQSAPTFTPTLGVDFDVKYYETTLQGAATLGQGADRAQVSWAYLAQNRWQPLGRRHVLSDTTFGLLTSGVVTLDLPAGATRDNAVLGRGQFWLRVSGGRDLDATADLVSVHAHATALARVLEPGAVPAHYTRGSRQKKRTAISEEIAVQKVAPGTH